MFSFPDIGWLIIAYSLQFPVEMNTSGSKTQQLVIFSHKFWLQGRLLINKDLFSDSSLHNTML